MHLLQFTPQSCFSKKAQTSKTAMQNLNPSRILGHFSESKLDAPAYRPDWGPSTA
jgi:hypothetical protein